MQSRIVRAAVLAATLVLVLEACGTTVTSPPPPSGVALPTASSAVTLPPSAGPTSVATGTATPAGSNPPAGLTGTWNGTWQDTTPDQAGSTFVLTWTQNGNALTGNIVVNGTPCLNAAVVTGTVTGTAISFGAVSGSNTVTYTGTIVGSTMQGSYTAPSACESAQGTWTATKQ